MEEEEDEIPYTHIERKRYLYEYRYNNVKSNFFYRRKKRKLDGQKKN